jgi:hypothetical protein
MVAVQLPLDTAAPTLPPGFLDRWRELEDAACDPHRPDLRVRDVIEVDFATWLPFAGWWLVLKLNGKSFAGLHGAADPRAAAERLWVMAGRTR